MYPETDIPPVAVTAERLERLRAALPERPAALRARLSREHGLNEEVVRQLVYGDLLDRFEALTARGRSPSLVARLLTQELPSVTGPGDAPTFDPSVDLVDGLLVATETGRLAKEGVAKVLAALASGAPTLDKAIEAAGAGGMSAQELAALISELVARHADLVRARGKEAFSPLMGDVMRAVRGRRDGKEVADELRRAIDRLLAEPPA